MHVSVDKDFFDYLEIYLSVIVPIITMYLGYKISDNTIKKQEKRKFNRVYQFFKDYYKSQVVSIKKQIALIKDQLSNVQQLIDTRGLNIVIVNQPNFILEMINKEELFSGWVDVNRSEPTELIEILKSINFTKLCFEGYNSYYTGFIDRQGDIRLRWINTIENLQKLWLSIFSNREIDISSIPSLTFIFNIYEGWIPQALSGEKPLKFTVDYLVEPLITHFTNNPENGIHKELVLNIIKSAAPFRGLYLEWKNEIETYENYLKGLIAGLERELGTLKDELPSTNIH